MTALDMQHIVALAREVGDQILIPQWGHVARTDKADGSPVTVVDKQASLRIIEGLQAITPHIPVISEEATPAENQQAMRQPLHWVVDPLDGTDTYLKGPTLGPTAGFGIHIALLDQENGPVRGVAYFPAQGKMYFTGNDGQAYRQTGTDAPQLLHVTRSLNNAKIRAAVPRVERKRPITVNGHPYDPVTAVGGEQICRVASGDADLMWRDRPDLVGDVAHKFVFSHWDVAAAHAILKAAGGNLYEMATGRVITYQNPDFAIPTCVAGHPALLHEIGFLV